MSSTANAGPNCTCRYSGQNFQTGAIMCIRGKLSRCEFVLNNTSWKTIADTCPMSMKPELRHSPIDSDLIQLTLLTPLQERFSTK